MAHRVTIAGGTCAVAEGLAARLGEGFAVRRISASIAPTLGTWRVDLTSISETEVACANSQTLVVLARTPRVASWKRRGQVDDVDRLVADSLARAARRCGVEHVILFACGAAGEDARESILRASGLPLSVLRGGGPDPAVHLDALVRRGPGGDLEAPGWTNESVMPPRPRRDFSSVQRFARPGAWSAAQLSQAYFRWLSSEVPSVRVESSADAENVYLLGVKVLVLRRLKGLAEPDSSVFEVFGGALARPGGRLELRILLDGLWATMHLGAFRPTLPGPLYAVTQALVHERLVRRFGAWVNAQPGTLDTPSGT